MIRVPAFQNLGRLQCVARGLRGRKGRSASGKAGQQRLAHRIVCRCVCVSRSRCRRKMASVICIVNDKHAKVDFA